MAKTRRFILALSAALAACPALAQHGTPGHGAPPASELRVGDLVITQPWSRATPQGARVAGGFMTIRNTGTQPERLVGGTMEVAGRFEVHEMATVDGVMRMRELTRGLVIPPGGSVELRPGGYHVMFMELGRPLAQGERLRGRLTFERAGSVDVTYDVRAVGASARH